MGLMDNYIKDCSQMLDFTKKENKIKVLVTLGGFAVDDMLKRYEWLGNAFERAGCVVVLNMYGIILSKKPLIINTTNGPLTVN